MIDAASPTPPQPYSAGESRRCGSPARRDWELRHNKPSGFAGRMSASTACRISAAL